MKGLLNTPQGGRNSQAENHWLEQIFKHIHIMCIRKLSSKQELVES